MDLRLIGANATDAERHAVAEATPAAEVVLDRGRAIEGGHRARSLRHLLLPVLAAVQSEIGWVSPGAVDEIATRLQIPPAEIFSVASFYALLSTDERPTRVAHVCDDVACRATGGEWVADALSDRTDVVASPCLGLCESGSGAFIQRAGEDDIVMSPATPAQVELALDGSVESGSPTPLLPRASQSILERIGSVDPSSLSSYRDHGGYAALSRAVERGGTWVLEQVGASGLRGRGGAAFPTAIKWQGAIDSGNPVRYLVCNADESEPGTFKDRTVMEGDPFSVIESMTIAGLAIGAQQGYLYVRGEYPAAITALSTAIDQARDAGLLGVQIMGAFDFDIELRRGQGAYICGEETALFNSIEGYRGEPRQKPPFPTEAGLFGHPTVVNNVETLVNLLPIVRDGGAAFARVGTAESTGTRLFCVSGAVAAPGVYEVEFGTTLGSILEMAGGVPIDLQAILLGGAAGSFVGRDLLDLPLTFEDSRAAGVALGSGVIVVYDSATDMRLVAQRIARFFRDESCGQCVPCRVGTVRLEEALARNLVGGNELESGLIDDIDRAMKDASICGLGHTAATAIQSAVAMGLI